MTKCTCTVTRHERQENRLCPVHGAAAYPAGGAWEFKFLPLPVATLGGNETRTIQVIPLLGGEIRELHFPVDTLDRLHIDGIKCDGRSVLGRLSRRGVFFLSAMFKRGSRVSVTVTNLRERETPVHGFAFGCNVRSLSRSEVVSEIEALGRQLTLALTEPQVQELKRQLAALEAMLKAT